MIIIKHGNSLNRWEHNYTLKCRICECMWKLDTFDGPKVIGYDDSIGLFLTACPECKVMNTFDHAKLKEEQKNG
jgi:hypothetical protein